MELFEYEQILNVLLGRGVEENVIQYVPYTQTRTSSNWFI